MLHDLPSIEQALSRLMRPRLLLAIDDFGMGYSSLPAPSGRSTCARSPKASTPARADA